jgi:NADPH:quinone reductase-like Zn-dependent oxidoreductase
VAAVRHALWPLVSSGQVRPVIQTVLPLESAAEAHRLMDGSAHVGKILLATTTATATGG